MDKKDKILLVISIVFYISIFSSVFSFIVSHNILLGCAFSSFSVLIFYLERLVYMDKIDRVITTFVILFFVLCVLATIILVFLHKPLIAFIVFIAGILIIGIVAGIYGYRQTYGSNGKDKEEKI